MSLALFWSNVELCNGPRTFWHWTIGQRIFLNCPEGPQNGKNWPNIYQNGPKFSSIWHFDTLIQSESVFVFVSF